VPDLQEYEKLCCVEKTKDERGMRWCFGGTGIKAVAKLAQHSIVEMEKRWEDGVLNLFFVAF
jgi:hypothetical protein